MLIYLKLNKNFTNSYEYKNLIKKQLLTSENVESLAKFFEIKLKYCKKNIELRCNLKDLIYDLNTLKQYLG